MRTAAASKYIVFVLTFLSISSSWAQVSTLADVAEESTPGTLPGIPKKPTGATEFRFEIQENLKDSVVVPKKYYKQLKEGKIAANNPNSLKIEIIGRFKNMSKSNRYVIVPIFDKVKGDTSKKPLDSRFFPKHDSIKFATNQTEEFAFGPNDSDGSFYISIPISSEYFEDDSIKFGIRKEDSHRVYPKICSECLVSDLKIRIEAGHFSSSLKLAHSRAENKLNAEIEVSGANSKYEVYEGHINKKDIGDDRPAIRPTHNTSLFEISPITRNKKSVFQATVIPKYNEHIHNHMKNNGFLDQDRVFYEISIMSQDFNELTGPTAPQKNATAQITASKPTAPLKPKSKYTKGPCGVIIVSGNNVHLRKSPSKTKSTQWRKLSSGEKFPCLAILEQNNEEWYRVSTKQKSSNHKSDKYISVKYSKRIP